MVSRDAQATPQFSQPTRQVVSMLVVIGLVAAGAYLAFPRVAPVFLANPFLNGFIALVFVIGVLSCFGQVNALIRSVRWIEGFANDRDLETRAPQLLAPLAAMLRTRGARMQLSATSSRSILESVAQRIDEDREITRYLGNTLIFLGLLGTFYGLATSVPALVATIQSLAPVAGEGGDELFSRLQEGLEAQLGGMGIAFASSLLGLAGSLVVGLLEVFAGHGQNRFYRELEEWVSSITRLGFTSGDEAGSDQTVLAAVIDNLGEQMEALQLMFTQSDASRVQVDARLSELASSIDGLAGRLDNSAETNALMIRVAEKQEELIQKIADSGLEGIDAESRMRLRSIDVQLLRILEEMTAGRQEVLTDLRTDIAALGRALRAARTGS